MRNILILISILSTPSVYSLEASQKAAVEELLKTMRIKENMAAMSEEMVNQQLQMQPCLEPLKPVLTNFMKESLNWDAMKDEIIEIYGAEFTGSELKDMTQFYKTPVGQKVIDKMPKLAGKGVQISMKILQEQQPKLNAALEEAVSKVDPNSVPEQCRMMYSQDKKAEPQDNVGSEDSMTKEEGAPNGN